MPTFHTTLTGIVQGVGFRPFVARAAAKHHIHGTVANKGPYVEIFSQGTTASCKAFLTTVEKEPPPRAIILHIETEELPDAAAPSFSDFQIIESACEQGPIYISPDIATCDACAKELYDPANRRYLHPFINCTDCGPRLTIETSAPYDRERTTMANFPMCDECAAEYHDPHSRRYDAQPVCCNHCGPTLSILYTHTPTVDETVPPRTNANLREVGTFSSGIFTREARTFPEGNAPTSSEQTDNSTTTNPITLARQALINGHILAIKGIGGFHLACDATNEQAVATLRARKHRPKKPFALMASDLAAIERVAIIESDAQKTLLTGHQKPILLLRKRPDSPIPANVAPDNEKLGLMLPYAPVQMLLFHNPIDGLDDRMPRLLVMTSGNPSGAPICHTDAEAQEALGSIADLILTHDRPIRLRADDTVLDWHEGSPYPIRRSRGYAPLPIYFDGTKTSPLLPSDEHEPVTPRTNTDLREVGAFSSGIFTREARTFPEGNAPTSNAQTQNSATKPNRDYQLLAIGGELKNTFALARGPLIYPSAYVGDTTDLRTVLALKDSIRLMASLLSIHPELIACDLHPRYNTTAVARELADELRVPLLPVQHHYAHVLSCLAENDCHEPVLGIALDGTGYGPNGTIWGGEILLADLGGYTRLASIDPFDQAGGDKAPREPWRIAIAMLRTAKLSDEATVVDRLRLCTKQQYTAQTFLLDRHLNTVTSTSAGRLFDAVSTLLGICTAPTYEGEAAIRLQTAAETWAAAHKNEAASMPSDVPELSTIATSDQIFRLSTQQLFNDLAMRRLAALEHDNDDTPGRLAYAFHAGLARLLVAACKTLRESTNLTTVALSGGVFQNTLLLTLTKQALAAAGFRVLTHHQVPPNDGGLCLGQAAAALYHLSQNHAKPR
ncbi:carbamoyltransferase HypF [Selenomonas sp.]|uniref:carbamoyltransferase HypF n=1 Tax=Selenomonas sp. TaxID=2053611 RepID=UPI0025F7A348|nr:carbamoyltransferase HypF [Selenomonas sp.]MCI6283092.1 carbamoyltransferase HypF [Selenomonas sp.]